MADPVDAEIDHLWTGRPDALCSCGWAAVSNVHGVHEDFRRHHPAARFPRPRVAFTPGSIQGVVTARKRHRCQNHIADGRHYIEPGDRYVANALPPDHPDIGNPGWWHLRVCLDCCPVEHDERVVLSSGDGF